MHIKSAEFVTSAVKPDQYPPESLPEIAFAGRSNVGKSSLINTLINRRRLVKTSSRPGRTQLLNFFIINDAFHMVDLPGYGYAKVPESVRRQWGPMIERYLTDRQTLRAVVLIVDTRRTPREARAYGGFLPEIDPARTSSPLPHRPAASLDVLRGGRADSPAGLAQMTGPQIPAFSGQVGLELRDSIARVGDVLRFSGPECPKSSHELLIRCGDRALKDVIDLRALDLNHQTKRVGRQPAPGRKPRSEAMERDEGVSDDVPSSDDSEHLGFFIERRR